MAWLADTDSKCQAGTIQFDPMCAMMSSIQDKVLMDADAKQMLFFGKDRLACINWNGSTCLVAGDAGPNVTTMRLDPAGQIVALVITDTTTSIRRYVGFGQQSNEQVNSTSRYVPNFLQIVSMDTVVLLRLDNVYDVICQGQVIKSITASPGMVPIKSTVNFILQYAVDNNVHCVVVATEAETTIDTQNYTDHGQVVGVSGEHGMYICQARNPQIIRVSSTDRTVRVIVEALENVKTMMMHDKYLLVHSGNTIRVLE